MQERGTDFVHIVRRDRCRHADGDARGPVGEQVGERRRQDDGLALLAVVGRAEIDRRLVDAFQQRERHRRQPRFGVAHRRGVIAVDVAEVALAVDQRVTDREILCETHQRVVDRDVAVRMVFADHDARAFLEAGVGVELQLLHGVQQPAMHRLQSVAHVGQGTRHDDRHRVGQIALADRVLQLGVGYVHGSSGYVGVVYGGFVLSRFAHVRGQKSRWALSAFIGIYRLSHRLSSAF